MTKNPIIEKMSRGLFYATFFIYLALRTLTYTAFRYEYSTHIFNQLAWICCFIALLNAIFLCRYSFRQIAIILAFCAFYVFLYQHTQAGENIFLASMMIVFSARYVKWERLLKFSLVLYIVFIIGSAVAEQVELVPTLEFFRGDVRRYSFGFSHPNVFGGYVLFIVIVWLLIRYKKLKVFDYIGWLLIAAFMWIVPNSRACTFSILLICLFTFIFKRAGNKLLKCLPIKIICVSFYGIMAAFSVLASYFYDENNALYVQIDQSIFTTRLSCAHTFFIENPITWFGQKLQLIDVTKAAQKGVSSSILDNFYVRQLLGGGIIHFLIIFVMFTYLVYRAIKINDQGMLIALIVLMIYWVYEARGLNLVYNILLVQVVYQILDPALSDGTKDNLTRGQPELNDSIN